MTIFKLQFTNNVFSANTLGAGSLLPYNKPAVIFDFLDPSSPWQLISEGAILAYQPGIPELKNGGLTVESTLQDSRSWLATPFNAATDTITLVPGANSTAEGRAKFMSDLLLLQRQANNYSILSGEFRPVHICKRELGDAGDCYSRIYDIQWAFSGDPFSSEPTVNQRLTITVIRYPYWTPIPLGTNPKWYTFEARGLQPEDFLAPSELARFPTDIGSYTISVVGSGSPSFTIDQEGYTPDIGYGDDVIDWVSGTGTTNGIDVGAIGAPVALTAPTTAYILSYWIRSESGSYDAVPLRTTVRRSDTGAGLVTGANFTVTLAENWKYVTQNFTSHATAPGVYFSINKNTSALNASYDIYGVSVKLAANPLDLTDFGNADPNLQNWFEDTVDNIWTRENPAAPLLNYMDIPAADIPGDGPALLSIVVDRNDAGSTLGNLYLARRLDVLSDEAIYTNTFMAEMSSVATATYVVDSTRGIPSSPGASASSTYVIQYSIGAGAVASVSVASWSIGNVWTGGKAAVFVRGDYTAGTPSEMMFFVRITTPGAFLTDPVTIQTQPRALANPASNAALNFMGILDFTQIKNALRDPAGLGVDNFNYTLSFVFAGRTAGAAATYRLTDVILMPYDDVMTTLQDVNLLNLNATSGEHLYAMMDNTGYLNQSADGIGLFYNQHRLGPNSFQEREVNGALMTLEPNRNNRLYHLYGGSSISPTDISISATNVQFRYRLNIIPQWRRLRAV